MLAQAHTLTTKQATFTPINRAQLAPVECGDLRRLGSSNDGGYVVPIEAVRSAKYLLSFGLLFDWSFEQAFLKENTGAVVHCYDHTVTFGRIALHSFNSFIKFFIKPSRSQLRGASKAFSYGSFFGGRARHFRNRLWYLRDEDSVAVADVFEKLDAEGQVFLKVDIENSEYRILDQVLAFRDRIDAMVVEFHDTDIMAETFNALIAKLRTAFHIVHIHANNAGGAAPGGFPCIVEITFKNRRLFAKDPPLCRRSYPVPGLDAPNLPELADLALNLEN